MAIDNINVGQELLNVPMGDMIRSMAFAIADSQWQLDKASIRVAELMSGQQLLRHPATGELMDTDGRPLKAVAMPDGRMVNPDVLQLTANDKGQITAEGNKEIEEAAKAYLQEEKQPLPSTDPPNYETEVDKYLAGISDAARRSIKEAAWKERKIGAKAAGEAEKRRELLREKAAAAPPVTPRVTDSRVFFGYTYMPERDAAGKIIYLNRKNPEDPDGDEIDVPQMIRVPKRVSMMELGFTPTFYQFVDTIIEVKLAIKKTRETVETRTTRETSTENTEKDLTVAETTKTRTSTGWHGWWWWGYHHSSEKTETKHKKVGKQETTRATSVDASYSSKYGYSVEGSSLLRTKLVPVPPPAILEDRIRQVMESELDYQEQVKAGLMVPRIGV